MPRRSRMQVPGGWYYVRLRGNGGRPIFSEDEDRAKFERLLSTVLARCRAHANAFCLEANQVHLLIQISIESVGRVVQRLTSQYSHWSNLKLHRSGHLFEQRHRERLIDPDAYLLKLIRYIHLVPVRAGLVSDPADYPWSSHRAYLGLTKKPWLTTQVALRMLVRRGASPVEAYRRFMLEDPDPAEVLLFERGSPQDSRVVGDANFLARIPDYVPVRRNPRSIEQLIDTVCIVLNVEREQVLSKSRKQLLCEARAVIAGHAMDRGASLTEAAKRLGRHPSTILVALDRYRALRPDLFESGALDQVVPLIRVR